MLPNLHAQVLINHSVTLKEEIPQPSKVSTGDGDPKITGLEKRIFHLSIRPEGNLIQYGESPLCHGQPFSSFHGL